MPCRAEGRRRLPPCREGEPRTDAEGGVHPALCDLRRVRGGGRRCEAGRRGAKWGLPRGAPILRLCEAGGHAGQWVGVLRGVRCCPPEQCEGDNNGHREAQGGGAREREDMQGGVRFVVSRILARCHEGRARGVVPSEKCL